MYSKGNSYFWVYTQISDQLGQISDQLGQKSDHGLKTFFGFYQLFCYPKFKHVLWIPNVKKNLEISSLSVFFQSNLFRLGQKSDQVEHNIRTTYPVFWVSW